MSKPPGPVVDINWLGDLGVIVGWNVYIGNTSKFYSLHGVDPKGVATSWIGDTCSLGVKPSIWWFEENGVAIARFSVLWRLSSPVLFFTNNVSSSEC